ncbi:choice-of-anchor A family protein [Cystobacter fuscus]|nr:choice-of-anchor A family protein [Cystobacter fuscus]
MTPSRHPSVASSTLFLVATTLLLWGCAAEPDAQDSALLEQPTLGHLEAPLVANGGFEDGTLSGWSVSTNLNVSGLRAIPPATLSDLNLSSGGAIRTAAVGGETETKIPVGLSAGSTLRYPKYGRWSAVVNSQGNSRNTNSLRQTFSITNADVDPADGKVHLRFALAPVLENPGHTAAQQPYFYVVVRNASKNKQLFSKFAYANQPGVPWKTDPSTQVLYTDWQIFDVAPGAANLDIGDQVELTVVAAGCSQSGHYGHAYVDSFGAFLPGLSIAASAPAEANAGDPLTYTYLVKNSGPGIAANVIVTQPLPANTTFVGLNAPGATCTTPAVGATGTVSCNVGALNPTASTTFQLTVKIAPTATGSVSNGSYTVRADNISPLIGPLVETLITRGVVYADLSLTKSDGLAAVTWGQPVQYVIEVTNHGPSAVTGARVTDTLPAQLTSATWTCTTPGGGACATPAGTGNIDATVNLPVNAKAVFTLRATVVNGSGSGRLSNLASVTAPAGVVDNDPTNNQGVDTDSIGSLYQVTVNKASASNGTGRVVTSPVAIDCDTDCTQATAQFMEGTLVSVTATAAPGSTFVGWTGACTGAANPCNFLVTSDTVLTAQFSSPKAPDGKTCSSANDCLSGSCVDGVCCNTGCTEQCMACNLPGLVGTCSPVTGAPVGGRPACASDGSLCGGTCNGASTSCVYPSANTVCRQASCSGNTETHAASCDGSGSCPSPTTSTCDPFVCGASACLTRCETLADCSTGNYCSAQGQCLFDLQPPVLQLPAPLILEATSSAGAVAYFTATATDAVVGTVPVTCTPASGTTFPLGTTLVTCGAQDGHGNVASGTFTVTVVDTTPPDLRLVGSSQVTLECGNPYLELGATASDICSGDLTSAIVTTGGVNSSAIGTYTVHYEVTDGVGLTASSDRTVKVQDTQAPVISLNPGPSVLECRGTPYQDPGATAVDVCAGDVTSNIVVTSNLNQSQAGQYTVTYTVTDPAGHVSTAARQLTVESCCVNIHLSDYNLFLLENYTGGHYIAGKLAAGGDITLTDFSVGDELPSEGTANMLVAGGNLALSRGGVWGDVWYGGSYSTDRSVIYRRGHATQGTPINFVARFAELRDLSSKLGRTPANGTTTIKSWGAIMLNGTNPSSNVFDVNASAFNGISLFSLTAPAGSLAVVNIRGASVSLPSFGIKYSGGINPRDVIFNFVDATRIDASRIGIQGTLLAPNARVTFNQGSWKGGLYAVSLTGESSGHLNPLTDRDLCP